MSGSRSPATSTRSWARLLVDFERQVFATRGRGTWEPDDPVTIAGKGSSRVLHDTGDLLDALTTPRTEGESEVVDQGDAYYAIFHRLGSRGMPRRDPAPEPSDSDVEGWANQPARLHRGRHPMTGIVSVDEFVRCARGHPA
ncbi:hypothetical protein G5V59_00220 [Nocardioides sp. W3-2-3]|uniref:hypothetical protein n=1 Tax=Nocardioides convexus TaxID=2712224 RepID=UPI0024189B70|nr:hypothetical protein [Nocardioides convexus]NGZ99398.1 hypothetical protein [Nocardioides convexus]